MDNQRKIIDKGAWIFFIYFLSIFLKIILFHWFCFSTVIVSSLWTDPLHFLSFYTPKVIISLFIASLLYLCKKPYIPLIIFLILDVWAICNLMYFNANDLFIEYDSIFMVNNLSGFWSSLLPLFHLSYLLFPVSSIVVFFIVNFFFHSNSINYYFFAIVFSVTFFLHLSWHLKDWYNKYYVFKDEFEYYQKITEVDVKHSKFCGLKWFIPFYDVVFTNSEVAYIPFYSTSSYYVYNNSFIHYFIAIIVNHFYEDTANLSINTEQLPNWDNLLPSTIHNKPQRNIILILIESLESWAVKDSICGNDIMPNLQRFYNNHYNHFIRCDSIVSQAKAGVSGDGQMIMNSGLLPLSKGAACMLYANNTFPNFGHFYQNSMIIAPSYSWNQVAMTKSYQYNHTWKPLNEDNLEKDVFDELSKQSKDISEPFCIMALSVASHLPFNYLSENKLPDSELVFPKSMPEDMRNYLKCLHYTDQCMYDFFQQFETNPKLQNSVIIITGDHITFRNNMLKEFAEFSAKHDIQLEVPSYTPLFIYSPDIENNITINSKAYQMDIYPTVLHAIGENDYPWKGFGVSLFDSVQIKNRSYKEDDAYRISEYLILNDYFKKYKSLLN